MGVRFPPRGPGCSVTVARDVWDVLVPVQIRAARQKLYGARARMHRPTLNELSTTAMLAVVVVILQQIPDEAVVAVS